MTTKDYSGCTLYLWHPLVAGVARIANATVRVVRAGETTGVYFRRGKQRKLKPAGFDVTAFVVEGDGPDVGVLGPRSQAECYRDTLAAAIAEAGMKVAEEVRINDTLGVTLAAAAG